MVYLDIELSAFLRNYGLTIEFRVCTNCDKKYPLDVPIAIKGYRGLEMQKHDCPMHYMAANFTPISNQELSDWRDILS